MRSGVSSSEPTAMISAFNSAKSRINIDDFASRCEVERGKPWKIATRKMCRYVPVLELMHGTIIRRFRFRRAPPTLECTISGGLSPPRLSVPGSAGWQHESALPKEWDPCKALSRKLRRRTNPRIGCVLSVYSRRLRPTGNGYQGIAVELKDGRFFESGYRQRGLHRSARVQGDSFCARGKRNCGRQSQALEFQGWFRHTHQMQGCHGVISF
jgi:hypothetical protein